MSEQQSYVAILGFEGHELQFAPVIASEDEIKDLKEIHGIKVNGIIPKNVLLAMLSSVVKLENDHIKR